MKAKPNRFLAPSLASLLSLSSTAWAVDRFKQNNIDDLNLSTSWDTAPGTGDVAVWDSTVIGANTVNLGSNLSWGGLRIADPGGDVVIGGANLLTLGASGLDTGSSRNLTLTNTGASTAITASGTLAGSTVLTLNSNTTRNWTGMTAVNFTGTLVLRGGTGTSGNFSNNWLALGAASSLTQTGSFHLDTGASLTNRGDFIITEGWGDGTTKPKLTLASLTGFGDFRSDFHNNTFRTLLVDQATDTTFSGRFVSASPSRGIDLEKSGAGILTLSGVSTQRKTLVTGGTLKLGNGQALGDDTAITRTSVTKNTVSSGGTIDLNGIATAYGYTIAGTGVGGNGALVNNATSIGTNLAQTANLALSANATIGGSGNWGLIAAGFGVTNLTLNDHTLVKRGAGVFGLASTAVTSGTIDIQEGTVNLGWGAGGSGVTADSTAVSLANAANVALTVSRSSSIGSLSGGGGSGGIVTLNAALTVGTLGTNTNYAGELAGASSLVKTGSGALTLTGANTHSGTTSVDEGTLRIGNGGSTGDIGSGAVSVASGATLEFNRSGLLDYKASVRMRNVSGAGDIVVDGGVKLFNYTGIGTGFDDANSWNNFSGDLIIKGGSEFQTIRNGRTAMGTAQVILGDATTSGTLSQIEGSWTWTNNIQLVGSANEIVNNSTGAPRSNKLQGVISGDGNVTFSDSTGAMNNGNFGFILTGTNTLTGILTVDTFVRVGGVTGDSVATTAGTGGTLGAADVVINAGKRLTFSRSDSHTVANTISGAGDLHVGATGISGTGTQVVTLTADNTYTGATNVINGTLLIGTTGSTHADSAVSVASGAALGGDGTVGGNASFENGSIFAWNLNVITPANTASASVADTFTITGNLVDGGSAGGSVFKILLAGNQTFTDNFWTANQSWTNVLTSGNGLALESLFTSFSYANADGEISLSPSIGSFSLSGTTLNYQAIPEPSSALAGLLLGLGLLRRRRTA